MEENSLIRKQYQSLLLVYYSIFIDVIAFGAFALYFFDGKFTFAAETKTSMQSIGVLIMMVSIPLGLMIFNKKTKEIDEMSNLVAAWDIYRKWWMIRSVLIVGAVMINLVFFVLLKDSSLLFAMMMSLVAWLFCKPNQLNIEDNNNHNNNDEQPELKNL
jgi:hypothetical protein